MQGVVRRFSCEREHEALERPVFVSQIMQPRVDFRLVVRLRVEIDVGIEVLESDPLVMDAGAVGAGDDDGVLQRPADRTRGLELAAAVGGEQAQVLSGHVETQVVLLGGLSIRPSSAMLVCPRPTRTFSNAQALPE